MIELLEEENILLKSAAEIDSYDRDELRLWCHLNARYGIVTKELVAWLVELIDGRSAIEIGSGHGDLAKHLGIRATDSKLQADPSVAAWYAAARQPTISYPDWVEKIEAVAAVRKYKPKVVIGSWITHWIDPRLPVPEGGGNIFGVRENDIVKRGCTYVMIGNLNTHRHKPILRLPHEELEFPWLRSRGQFPALDRIFVWNL